MKTNAKQSNMLPELVGFEPMGIAEAEMVEGGKKIKIVKHNPDGTVTIIKISY